jgi:hypothetical protein
MIMKLNNVRDIEGLFRVIDQCKGKVELIGDDIRINLKSKLSQYFSLAKLFSDGEIPEMELKTEYGEDARRLMEFLMYQ